jgi:hypothetical protein
MNGDGAERSLVELTLSKRRRRRRPTHSTFEVGWVGVGWWSWWWLTRARWVGSSSPSFFLFCCQLKHG